MGAGDAPEVAAGPFQAALDPAAPPEMGQQLQVAVAAAAPRPSGPHRWMALRIPAVARMLFASQNPGKPEDRGDEIKSGTPLPLGVAWGYALPACSFFFRLTPCSARCCSMVNRSWHPSCEAWRAACDSSRALWLSKVPPSSPSSLSPLAELLPSPPLLLLPVPPLPPSLLVPLLLELPLSLLRRSSGASAALTSRSARSSARRRTAAPKRRKLPGTPRRYCTGRTPLPSFS